MRKCNVCGKRFRLLAKNRYEVIRKPVGLNCLTEATIYYNAFDCTHCGCQNIVGVLEKEKVRDIKEQPGEESEEEPKTGQWIPVSKRLPEAGKLHDVLVTVRSKDPEMTAGHVQEAEYDARDPEGEWDFDIGTWSGREQLLVTAWMPLPEPYKEEADD